MRKDRRNLTRITSNFVQLFATFAMGLMIVLLLLELGEDVYGIVAVLTAGAGMATLLRGVVNTSMVPKLSEAWHGSDSDRFAQTFNSSLILSCLCGFVTLGAFGAISCGLRMFSIPSALLAAATLYFWIKSLQVLFTIALGPLINMYVVTERMVHYNIFLIIERSVELVSAIIILLVIGQRDPGTCLVVYGSLVSTGIIVLHLVAACYLMIVEPRVRLRLRSATWTEGRRVLSSFGWNAAYVVAVNLHKRFNILIMSAIFGLAAGMMFSLAAQLTSYIRRLTMGLIVGLNAVSARLQSRQDSAGLRTATGRHTLLQSCLIFPAMGIMFFAADDLIRIWIGNRIANSAESIPMIGMICRVLLVGVAARSLSEGWMAILAGCGRVRTFSPFVLAGAAMNPLIIFLGVLVLPPTWKYLAPAISFCTIYAVVHLLIVPHAAARHLGTSVLQLYRPCLGPLVSALSATPVFLVGRNRAGQGGSLIVAVGAYMFAYAAGLVLLWKLNSVRRRRVPHADDAHLHAADGSFVQSDQQPNSAQKHAA